MNKNISIALSLLLSSFIQIKGLDTWRPNYTFNDVIGCESIKAELKKALTCIIDPENTGSNTKHQRCFLFSGPPCSGKSFLAEAFMGEV